MLAAGVWQLLLAMPQCRQVPGIDEYGMSLLRVYDASRLGLLVNGWLAGCSDRLLVVSNASLVVRCCTRLAGRAGWRSPIHEGHTREACDGGSKGSEELLRRGENKREEGRTMNPAMTAQHKSEEEERQQRLREQESCPQLVQGLVGNYSLSAGVGLAADEFS